MSGQCGAAAEPRCRVRRRADGYGRGGRQGDQGAGGTLQALVGLGKSLEPPKPPEKKSGGTVRVVLSGEAEELSQ